jgi:hypothetical protein
MYTYAQAPGSGAAAGYGQPTLIALSLKGERYMMGVSRAEALRVHLGVEAGVFTVWFGRDGGEGREESI